MAVETVFPEQVIDGGGICINFDTGRIIYTQPTYRNGFIVFRGDRSSADMILGEFTRLARSSNPK